ncbi:MAG TPA: DoxX family protein [Candidatus Nanoarchaeia archaeon]|nr:DoxX family protein [Candidatus Nanoarchaeia archaeon]
MKEFNKMDKRITNWMKKIGLSFLRYSLAVIFIWFGILKLFGTSSAQELIANTIYWFSPTWFVPFLGWWEIVIGLCFLYKPLIRIGIPLLFLQMAGTFLPLIILPNVVYTNNIPFFFNTRRPIYY